MAATAINTGKLRLLIATSEVEFEGHLMLSIATNVADEEYRPIGQSLNAAKMMTEEEYHRDLRKQSKENGHFVPEYSTNPEWNPENGEAK